MCVCRPASSFFDGSRGPCAVRASWVDTFFSWYILRVGGYSADYSSLHQRALRRYSIQGIIPHFRLLVKYFEPNVRRMSCMCAKFVSCYTRIITTLNRFLGKLGMTGRTATIVYVIQSGVARRIFLNTQFLMQN